MSRSRRGRTTRTTPWFKGFKRENLHVLEAGQTYVFTAPIWTGFASFEPSPPKRRKPTHRWRARCKAAGLSRTWIRFLAKRPRVRDEVLRSGVLAEEVIHRAMARMMAEPIRRRVNYKALGRELMAALGLSPPTTPTV